MTEYVAVYCPHSYNFSGQLHLVLATRVRALDVASADAMAFVVSGGVSGPAGCPDSFRPPFPLANTPPSGSPNVF